MPPPLPAPRGLDTAMQPPPPPPPPRPAAPSLAPLQDPGNLDHLRRAVSEALKSAPGGLPRTLGALPHMATGLAFQEHTLRWLFPPNVRNTVQDLEREAANPHLLEALRQVLPGLARLTITFETDNQARPEDVLRGDPAFQRLLAETGGEVVEIRREE